MEKFFKNFNLLPFYLGEGVYAQNRFKIGLDPGYTYSIMKTNLSIR